MTATEFSDVQASLVDRRDQLAQLHLAAAPAVQALIAEIDQALARLASGTFGHCTVCNDGIETDRLACDPLATCCAEHPTPAELARVWRDLELARDVQVGLLPGLGRAATSWQYHYGYEPASQVGGDFCDVLVRPDGHETLVIVGDVAGKGVGASMLMSSLMATFRSLVSVNVPTSELLPRANALFLDTAPAPAYATVLLGSLRPDGALDWYNAGHWPPVLRHRGLTTALAGATGLPVGLFADACYQPARVRLDAGDTLVFFTDGVIDAENPQGHEYGLPRLQQAVTTFHQEPVGTLVEECLADVRVFRAGQAPLDDQLLFAIRAT